MTISLVRTLLLYIVVIIAVRLMGKRQISELQTTELVIMLLISDIAVIPMQDTGQSLVSGLIPILILVASEILLSVIMLKSSRFRKLICGGPVIVINDGKLEQKQMKRLRMSTEDLFEELRQLNVFSLSEVAYAIVETNGKMSILKKFDQQETTASMCGIPTQDTVMEVTVVSDGEMLSSSMKFCCVDESWIRQVLQSEQIYLEDVFIMTANKRREYSIIPKERM